MSEIVANHLKEREHIKIYDPSIGILLINFNNALIDLVCFVAVSPNFDNPLCNVLNMFYKYLSDREIQFLKQEKYTDEHIKNISADDEKLTNPKNAAASFVPIHFSSLLIVLIVSPLLIY